MSHVFELRTFGRSSPIKRSLVWNLTNWVSWRSASSSGLGSAVYRSVRERVFTLNLLNVSFRIGEDRSNNILSSHIHAPCCNIPECIQRNSFVRLLFPFPFFFFFSFEGCGGVVVSASAFHTTELSSRHGEFSKQRAIWLLGKLFNGKGDGDAI